VAEQKKGRGRSGGSSGERRSGKRSAGKRVAVDHREIEWQFEASDLGIAESWLRQHSEGTGLVVEPEGKEEISDTYYDTEDWRLYRAGYALRVRKADGEVEATLKTVERETGEGNVVRRREITEPLKDEKPETLTQAPGPVGERLRALAGGREPKPLFEIKNERRNFALRLEDEEDRADSDGEVVEDASGDVRPRTGGGGFKIGVVTLDRAELALAEGEEPVAIQRVEVETGEGTAPTPELRGFVDELQFALSLTPATTSKYEAGLYAAGLTPEAAGDLGGPREIEPSMTTGEAAFAVLRGQFVKMKSHEPGTRLGEDPEELHDMRVATRRMRAAIKLFEGALPERARWLREELRQVAGSLGEVRDLDVQMERLEAHRADAGEEEREFLGKVLEILGKRRAEARARMLDTLNSGRYERFVTSFAEMLRQGPGAEGELSRKNGQDLSTAPVTEAAPALLSRRYKKWRKVARSLDESSTPEAYHDLRKEGKKLRYALEFFSGLYDGATDGLVRPLKALQDDLGEHQDAVVFSHLLRDLGTNTDGPRISRGVAFTMGVEAERYRRQAQDIRAGLAGSESYRTLLKGKAWKGLEDSMRKAARKSARTSL
jgi:CHAD domain-containing protein